MPSEITGLLQRWGEGDPDAFDRLVPIVYDRLRQLARRRLRDDPNATLDTTGLVHEAYLKLVDVPRIDLRDRSHFLALASRVMQPARGSRARTSGCEARRWHGRSPSPLSRRRPGCRTTTWTPSPRWTTR